MKENSQIIQWLNSGIIEVAELQPNGAIVIKNLTTEKKYSIPRNYVDLNIRIVNPNEMVSLGAFLPKLSEYRK